MKLGEKTVNVLACVAILIAISLLANAWSLWTERQLAVAKADWIWLVLQLGCCQASDRNGRVRP